MITTCKDTSIIIRSKIGADMILKKIPFKPLVRENMTDQEYALAVLDCDSSLRKSGFLDYLQLRDSELSMKERRAKSLLRLQTDYNKKNKKDKEDSSYRLIMEHIDELLNDPPAWIGCAEGKIVTGEIERDVRQEFKNCSESLFLVYIADF
jgi:hypothetical protein